MKIYISGAITNNLKYKEQFAEAERKLIQLGHEVVNPAKNSANTYKDYIDKGLFDLMRCEAIYLLKGWQKSDGANLEYNYAVTVGLQVLQE